MCGFVGVLSRDQQKQISLPEAYGFVEYRGSIPGSYWDSSLALACTRLPRNGNPERPQPVISPNGQAFCLNGEIYNATALNLDDRGNRHDASDTELVAKWLTTSDAEFPQVNLLKGEYALALVPPSRNRVFLARDALGTKPLFWANSRDTVAFGSSARAVALLAFGSYDLDFATLSDMFWFGISESGTCFRGVKSVLPGCALSIDLVTGRATAQPIVHASMALTLSTRLERAVRLRVDEGSHPYIAYSGGLDSDLLWRSLNSPSVPRLQLVIGAQQVSQGIMPVRVTVKNLRDALDRYVVHHEKPLISLTGAAMHVLALSGRSMGCGTVLSGEGADELFAGYDHYYEKSSGHPQVLAAMERRQLLSLILDTVIRSDDSRLIGSLSKNSDPRSWLTSDRAHRLAQHLFYSNSDVPCLLAGIEPRLPYVDLADRALANVPSDGPKAELQRIAPDRGSLQIRKRGLFIRSSKLWGHLDVYTDEVDWPGTCSYLEIPSLSAASVSRAKRLIDTLPLTPSQHESMRDVLARFVLAAWSIFRMMKLRTPSRPQGSYTLISPEMKPEVIHHGNTNT